MPCEVRGLEAEEVRVITAAHPCPRTEELRRVVEAIRETAEATGQKAVGIRGTSRFAIIPTEKLQKLEQQKPA